MSKKIVILGDSGSAHIQRWAAAIVSRGYDLTVISLGGRKIDGIETINIEFTGSREVGYLKNSRLVNQYLSKINPDLVHAHYATGFGLWGMRSGYHPYLLSVWGADIIDFPSNIVKRTILRKILKSADMISSTSLFLAERTIALLPETEKKMATIPFGVNLPEISKEKYDSEKIRLVYIKAHRKKYGPDYLIRAMAAVVKQNPAVELTFAGEGEMTTELKAKVKELDLDGYIKFVGYVENDTIYRFLSDYDVMVMPSVMDSESFGVAVLEASSVGLPVIATRVGGVPEVLRHEETGILIPPMDEGALTDAILKLSDNCELRKKYGEAGRRFVGENYNWDLCVDKMTDLYDRLIRKE